MGNAHNSIIFHPEKCAGCSTCMLACARAKTGTDDIRHSRIAIQPGAMTLAGDAPAETALALCRQCGDPKCVQNCPSTALSINPDSGVIDWNGNKCIDCLLCTVGCSYGGIAVNEADGRVMKCDMCAGDPACVKACPNGALELNRSAELYQEFGHKEDLFVPGLSACQGCNSELLIRHTLRKVGSNVVLATPPGCIPGMGTVGYNGKTGSKVPVFHPLLTNTASMLAGIKKQYNRLGRDVTMLALAGDGGVGDVGFQSLSGAAERNEQMLFVCVDNEGYMNTGMQSSGSTPAGSWTSTTPVGKAMQGKRTDAKSMAKIMMMHNCEYVATASLAFMDDFYAKLDKAIEAAKTGFAYLHVYSPCPTGWRVPSEATIEVCRRQVESNFVTLWEFDPERGMRFTRSVDQPTPLADYLRLIGKYRHLDHAQIDHLQQQIDRQISSLKRVEQSAAAGSTTALNTPLNEDVAL